KHHISEGNTRKLLEKENRFFCVRCFSKKLSLSCEPVESVVYFRSGLFRSLWRKRKGPRQREVVTLVRHVFCGVAGRLSIKENWIQIRLKVLCFLDS